MWNATINNLRAYFAGEAISQLGALTQNIQYAQQYNFSVLELFFKTYGILLIFILISLLVLPVILKKALSDIEGKNLLSLYGPLAAIAAVMVILLFLNLSFSPLRLMGYIGLLCVILVGFNLNTQLEPLYSNNHNRFHNWVIAGLVCFIIIAAFTNSTLQLYPSSYTLLPNDQVTRTDLQGMNWFFQQRNPNYELTGLTLVPSRFADYLLNAQERSQQMNLDYAILNENSTTSVPWHFGYDKGNEFGELFNQKAYLLIDQEDRDYYQDLYPEIQNVRLTTEDFAKLDRDPSLALIYSNGGLDICDVTPAN